MKRIAIISTILLLLVASGCKSTRDTQETSSSKTTTVVTKPKEKDPKEVMFNKMIDTYSPWQSIVAKGSVSLGSLSSTYELRMIKDQAIQISLRPLLGIEVGRLVVQDDKIYIFDKINKRYIEESLSKLGEKLPFEPTISNLQSILMGQPFIMGETAITAKDYKKFDITLAGEDWTMRPKKKIDKIDYLFSMNNETTESLQVSQTGMERRVTCHYQDYLYDAQHLYPSYMKISALNNKKEYTLKLNYSTMSWDTNPDIQPLSTRGYSRTTLTDLIDMLL